VEPIELTRQIAADDIEQTNGDCNACHSAEGEQGAPGRIVLP